VDGRGNGHPVVLLHADPYQVRDGAYCRVRHACSESYVRATSHGPASRTGLQALPASRSWSRTRLERNHLRNFDTLRRPAKGLGIKEEIVEQMLAGTWNIAGVSAGDAFARIRTSRQRTHVPVMKVNGNGSRRCSSTQSMKDSRGVLGEGHEASSSRRQLAGT
jgi:hypothetical protein